MDEKGRVWGSRHSFSLGRYAGRFSFASESGRFFFTFVVFFCRCFGFFYVSLFFFVFLEMDQWRLGRFGPRFFGGGSSFSLAASTVVRLFLGNSNARECIVLLVLCH